MHKHIGVSLESRCMHRIKSRLLKDSCFTLSSVSNHVIPMRQVRYLYLVCACVRIRTYVYQQAQNLSKGLLCDQDTGKCMQKLELYMSGLIVKFIYVQFIDARQRTRAHRRGECQAFCTLTNQHLTTQSSWCTVLTLRPAINVYTCTCMYVCYV
jgi:hypothetical protein